LPFKSFENFKDPSSDGTGLACYTPRGNWFWNWVIDELTMKSRPQSKP